MSSTVLPVSQVIENVTEPKSMTGKDDDYENMSTTQIFLLSINTLSLLLSVICLITHLVKFFRTNTAQTLATRNLTTYCAYLLVIYFISNILSIIIGNHNLFPIIDLFARILVSCSLFVMAFDTCLCLRNTATHLTASSLSESNFQKFITYRLCEIIVSLVLTAFVEYYATNYRIRVIMAVIVILSIHLVCVVFCIASVRYITMASTNKTKLMGYLSLLVIIGTISVVLYTALGFMMIFCEGDHYKLGYACEVFVNSEGLLIGIFFTFKKNTFKMKVDRSIAFRNSVNSHNSRVLQ